MTRLSSFELLWPFVDLLGPWTVGYCGNHSDTETGNQQDVEEEISPAELASLLNAKSNQIYQRKQNGG